MPSLLGRIDPWYPRLLCAVVILLCTPLAAAARLLVVSQGDARVLEFDEADGSFVAPFVEPVTTGFAFPGGIAVRPSNGRLYIASTSSGEIWIYDTSSGLPLPPVAATGLLTPGGLVFDAAGSNLYFIADFDTGFDTNAALWKLDLAGSAITMLANDPTASFTALALEGNDLYASDSSSGTVVRYSTAGGGGTTIISGLFLPGGVLFLSPSVLLVAESGADRILEYHLIGGNWIFDREVLAASAGVDWPFGLALAPDGRLSVSGAFSNDVTSVDLVSLNTASLVSPDAGLAVPGQIVWSGNTLLVASRSNNAVPYFDQSGSPTGIVAQGLTAPADAGMALTAEGNVVIASAGANNLVEYEASTGDILRTFPNACTASFTQPFDVEVDASGGLYVSCAPTDGIRRFDAIGVSVPFVVAGSGGLTSPRGLRFGPNGNLFVASLSGEVLEYDGADGSFVGVFVDTTGNGGGPVDPHGLVFHQGALYITSFFPSEVKKFDAATGAFIQTFVASGSGGLSGPVGLAFGLGGDLYVTSRGDDSVKRYDGLNGNFVDSFVVPGSGGLDQPIDLVFSAGPPVQTVRSLQPLGLAMLVMSLIVLGGLARNDRVGWIRSRGEPS